VLILMLGYSWYVAALVVRSNLYSSRQKITQVILVFVIPIIGAILAHALLTPKKVSSPPDRDFIPQGEPSVGEIPRTHNDGAI
jgi:hypothetical protein